MKSNKNFGISFPECLTKNVSRVMVRKKGEWAMQWEQLDRESVLALLPDRNPRSHKGDYGRLLLLCGSRGYTGAAALAAMGALRAGGGLVYLGVPESIYAIEAVKLTEPVVLPLPDEAGAFSPRAAESVRELLPGMDAVLFGPGVGRGAGALAVLETVLREAACPVVLDADGINLLSGHKDWVRGRQAPTVLTPHEGEFTRLFGPIEPDRAGAAVEAARELSCILVLKGWATRITDGRRGWRNPTGNPGMAVGGSGDALAGILTALLGQKLPAPEAAACAVWLHGAAGDRWAEKNGQYGLLPTDLLEELPRLMK